MRVRAIIFAAAFALVVRASHAEEQPKQEPPKEGQPKDEKGSRGSVVDPLTGKRLNEAVEKIHAQKYGEAKAALGKVNLDRLSPYELSRVQQLFAAVEQAQGNYGAAREALDKAIASGGMN